MEYSDDLKFKVITSLREHDKDNPDIDEVVDQFQKYTISCVEVKSYLLYMLLQCIIL